MPEVTELMFLGSMHAWTARAAGMPRKEARALALVRNEAASCPFCTVFDKPDPDGRRCAGCPLDNPKEMAFPYNCCGGLYVVYHVNPTAANALPVLCYILEKYREWRGKPMGEAKPEQPILREFVEAMGRCELYEWGKRRLGQEPRRPPNESYLPEAKMAREVLKRADAESHALQIEATRLRDVVARTHEAIGENRASNDDSLPETVAAIIKDYRTSHAEIERAYTLLQAEMERTEKALRIDRAEVEEANASLRAELEQVREARRGEVERADNYQESNAVLSGGLRITTKDRDCYKAIIEGYKRAGVEASKDSHYQQLRERHRGLKRKLRGLRKHCKQQAAHHAGKMADTAAEVHCLRTELAAAIELIKKPERTVWCSGLDEKNCGWYLDGQWVGPSLEAVVAAAAKGGDVR